MEAVAEHELSVLLSSHLVADLERVCDHLIVLVASRVQVAGDVEAARHPPPADRRPPHPGSLPGDQEVIEASHTDRQSTLLVRSSSPIYDPSWAVEPLGMEDLVLAYMGRAVQPEQPRRATLSRVQP